jgi:hypothetical protein
MKKFIFGLLFIAITTLIFWQFGYLSLGELGGLDGKLWIITANLKYLAVIGLYIAWRVTPESKPPQA